MGGDLWEILWASAHQHCCSVSSKMQGNVYFSAASFPLFLPCHAIVCAALLGQQPLGRADSWFLCEESSKDMSLASCTPPCRGTLGQGSFQPVPGAERQSLPLWLELSPAAQLAVSLQFRILTLVHTFFPKRSPSGQVAKKSTFRADAPPPHHLRQSHSWRPQAGAVPGPFA